MVLLTLFGGNPKSKGENDGLSLSNQIAATTDMLPVNDLSNHAGMLFTKLNGKSRFGENL
jgi:hypothetical protein